MPEPLKNIYNPRFFDGFTHAMQVVSPTFDKDQFLTRIYDAEWEGRELKQRMRHLSITLKAFLPESYPQAIGVILKLVSHLKRNQKGLSLEYMFLPDFIELFGLDDLDASLQALEEVTQFTSCEFAVRPFIVKYPDQMMDQMLKWSTHSHHAVRRFASEGCRPRLPWAMALPALKADPGLVLPILENLKEDESEFVRKSVANNLNDISKDHPDVVLSLVKKWKGISPEVDWILKHGSRTLLKAGNPEALGLFGLRASKTAAVADLRIVTPTVKIGGSLEFTFKLLNTASKSAKLRVEYGVYYQKANGTLSKKVYKISEKEYPGNSTTEINRKQPFKLITTRVFHPGQHQLSIIVNGREFEKHSFELAR